MARVLLVDDDTSVQQVLAAMLEAGGHQVVLAAQGKRVLQDLQDCIYDLVVTDLRMPEITGWNIAEWVQANRPGIPVLAISGANDAELEPGWMKRFAAVVTKPVRRQQLLEVVAKALQPSG